jgi:hypothetical protein
LHLVRENIKKSMHILKDSKFCIIKTLDLFRNFSLPVCSSYSAKKEAKELERTDSVTLYSPSTGTPITPHKAMKTKGTEYEWRWVEIFSLFKVAEYRPAINIEHWSERYGIFAIICLGESVSIK